jgi:hypothetical protein
VGVHDPHGYAFLKLGQLLAELSVNDDVDLV